jgi:archaellin
MNTIRTRSSTLAQDESGFFSTGPAILMIGFVMTAAMFAASFLHGNSISNDSARSTILAGIAGARSNLLLRGHVIAEDTDVDGNVDKVYFHVTTARGGQAIDLSPGRTIIRYVDASQSVMFDTAAKFSLTPKGDADSDNIAEPAEVHELALLNMETNLTAKLAKGTTFTIEVMMPKGAVFIVERRTPLALERYNDLDSGTTVGTAP